MKHAPSYLQRAAKTWNAGAPFRQNRARNMRYTFGDQWSDIVPDGSGQPIRERDYAIFSGSHPITNNLIRPLVKAIVGRYRNDHRADYTSQIAIENSLAELDARMLEEFLISGCAVQRIDLDRRPERTGIWIDNVPPDAFFVNAHFDPRGTDVNTVGMLHSMTLSDIITRFSGGNNRRVDEILQAYAAIDPTLSPISGLGVGQSVSTIDFSRATDGLYRVIELWTLDSVAAITCHDTESGQIYHLPTAAANDIARENRVRRARKRPGIRDTWTAPVHWHCRWLTPQGDVLASYPSPYKHASHPFLFKFYPLTDGAVHPFVDDLIEQQRAINRLVTVTDHMMAVSAKGVLLFPEDAKCEDIRWDDIADRWASCNGIIPIRSYATQLPQQVTVGNFSGGVAQVLDTQLELFRLTSGVSGVLTGADTSAKGSDLLRTQVSNSVIAISDLLDSFSSLILLRSTKLPHLISHHSA